ncbi:sensor histidine kinase [Streptomyces sp. NBC_00986]|uniref:sensor histidine kinase n=1 Tax=Streptomyces sp. NBC_00986 TaxID=2903702 RepID=UPI0038647A2F|nr:sensor histidine kinase [Streptomyces sp. NBC_00986]
MTVGEEVPGRSVSARLRRAVGLLLRPGGRLPRPTGQQRLVDAALALVLTCVSVQYAWGDGYDEAHRHRMTDLVILVFLASASLAWRRRYPLAVLWLVTVATALTPDDVARLTFYACVIGAYSAAAYSPHRLPTLASLAVAVAVISRSGQVGPANPYFYVAPTVPTQYVPLFISVPIVVAAIGLRTWKLRAAETRTRLTAVESARAEELHRAVEHERARMARELHDVVTHNVSVMVIQAGAARTIMDKSPERAREALLAVEAGGRAAMGELRDVMGLLTMELGQDPAELESLDLDLDPQPGLDRLEALVGRMRGAGVPVELTVSGAPRPLPAGIELAAYRVVQEALTNTVKHASGADASVQVSYGDGELHVEVTDTGGRPGPAAATGNGRGLIGLRERLAVYGGTLRTGPRPLGGYRVRALIPLEDL